MGQRPTQFVTNTSRIQLFQDAALIGKAVNDGTLSCKSTLLANDKSLGKLIVGHLGEEGVPICLGTSATDLGIETEAGKKTDVQPLNGNAYGKADAGPRELIVYARKL